ncbi:hypothetical protein ACFLXB_06475 [Chloroflexota bacterium]
MKQFAMLNNHFLAMNKFLIPLVIIFSLVSCTVPSKAITIESGDQVISTQTPEIVNTGMPVFNSPTIVTDQPKESTSLPVVSTGEIAIEWRDIPVIPSSISDYALEIYAKGRILHNYPYAFSVIGDGIIPVLDLKADNLEGSHQINDIINKIAYEFEIPLWNYWRLVQPLSNHGLQNDNVHLTWAGNDFSDTSAMDKAWPWRNLTALQILELLLKSVQ